MQPEYVKEFHRWRSASQAERIVIIARLTKRGRNFVSGPDLSKGPNLKMIMPNGKPLGQCTKQDLLDFEQWERALAGARKANADVLGEWRS
jgi:hypothetical protein